MHFVELIATAFIVTVLAGGKDKSTRRMADSVVLNTPTTPTSPSTSHGSGFVQVGNAAPLSGRRPIPDPALEQGSQQENMSAWTLRNQGYEVSALSIRNQGPGPVYAPTRPVQVNS